MQQNVKKQIQYCDECGKVIAPGDLYYFIGDNDASRSTDNNIFCSEDCILKCLMVSVGFMYEND